MHSSRPLQRFISALSILILGASQFAAGQQEPAKGARFPFPEKLSYHVEWRLITAGAVTVELEREGSDSWQTNLHLESAGLVNRLYRVVDTYKASSDAKFCGSSAFLDAAEGKRHSTTHLTFDNTHHRVEWDDHDLVKNTTEKKELDIAPCTYEITGALASLRAMDLPAGKWATFPITDGKKMARGKIEAQAKETLVIDGKTYPTIRYEVFLFDNVLYKRKGRLLVWITDNADRIPVQFRLLMGFPIGTVTVQLDKQQKM